MKLNNMIAVCALILCARPYRTENTSSGVKKRDIFLCLDVSYSIYELNYDIVDHLEAVVSGLQGDRFGICFFNTSSVMYVPMTDDYDFVIERLEDLKGYFQLQKDYMDNFGEYDYYYEIPEEKLDYFEQLIRDMDYFEAGTVPTDSCDTHVAVTLCAKSGRVVGKYCPKKHRYTRIFRIRPKNAKGTTEDSRYELTFNIDSYICDIHTEEWHEKQEQKKLEKKMQEEQEKMKQQTQPSTAAKKPTKKTR